MVRKEVSDSLWTAESRAPALTCTDCCSKIYALERRRNKAASWGSPFILTCPVLHCFLSFFWANHHVIHGASAWTPSKLWPGMMGLMVLQRMHGWKLRKYSLTWLRLLVGSMEARGELGLWLLRILCVWNGPLRRSETLSKSDNLCWALPLLLFFLDFTFSPQRAKDIYRNIQ